MKVCRALLFVPLLLLLWAGIASAQVVGPGGGYPPTVLPTSAVSVTTLPPVTATLTPITTALGGGGVLGAGEGREGVNGSGGVNGSQGVQGNGLARTGSNNSVPLIQAAIVLLGAGTLLVMVARRRRTVRRAAATPA